MGGPVQSSGRLLERQSNLSPRGMIVHDRTRLIDQLNKFIKNDRPFVFHYPTQDGMNKSAVIFFCVLP